MARLVLLAALSSLATTSLAGVIDGQPDPAPPGYYDSPVTLPLKDIKGDGGLEESLAKARAFVAELSTAELLRLTYGTFPSGTHSGCGGAISAVPRLNFPGICLNDGPIGVRTATPTNTSAFPAGIAVAATFDRGLMYSRGLGIGEEFRGRGVNVALAPGMNMMRAPAAGRNWEMAGGDPFLAGVVSYETVKAIQSSGVIACAKHLVGNEQEHFRGVEHQQASSSNIDDRTMHEIYSWPFAESVRAGVGSIMCSYNQINSTFGCENSKTLNGLLKEELDFQGFVMSDWFADNNFAAGALSGMDLSMPGFVPDGSEANGTPYGAPVLGATVTTESTVQQAYDSGVVSKARLEDMVTRIMTQWFHMGQDTGFPTTSLTDASVDVQGDHAAIIREVGAASAVLLKNTAKALPFTGSFKSYGIFGTDARSNQNGLNSCAYQACAEGHIAQGWGSGSNNYPYLVDPVSAITSHLGSSAVVESNFNDFDLVGAAALAAASEVCLVFASANSGENVADVDMNYGDRRNITLWHDGEALISTVASNCANTVVIIHTVGPVLMESFIHHENVTAVLMAGLPGQESGNSLVDVIFGAVAPSGRLPYTIGKLITDFAAEVVYTAPQPSVDCQFVPGVSGCPLPGVPVQINYDEALLMDYRWFDQHSIEPTFEFGFGLSYTTFNYSKLAIESTTPARHRAREASHDNLIKRATNNTPGGPSTLYDNVYTATFEVENVGDVDSHEVSQLYIAFPASAGEPPKVLRGFERTMIKKGDSATVTIDLQRKHISIWDVVSQAWVVPSGEFTVLVGRSSRDLPLSATFTI